jgi:hypothetical protein
VEAVNNKRIIEFYDIVKIKPTFVYQLLLWGVEAIPIDADVVYLENALRLFHNSADFETQCDSKELFRIPSDNDTCYMCFWWQKSAEKTGRSEHPTFRASGQPIE